MNFQLTSNSGRGNFTITDQEGKALSTIAYESWFSSTASATVDGREVVIKSRNIWSSNFDVFVDGVDRGDITFNWKGHIIIKLTGETGATQTVRLRMKGFWNYHFVLENEQETILMELRPTFKWQKMNYNYDVHFAQDTVSSFDRALLLIICGYGANLYMTMMAGAAA
ncbi:hypothetical protein [Rudanella lutea]|uniref:hypothetical protein n=1 Tax=Rudanella lutea TaxID=451374 RepID=UPI00035D04A0|nr:hypothetical protein [Rudanella lutea]